MKTCLLILLFIGALTGCQSMLAPQIGMSEKTWLRTTLVGDLVGMENGERVWRSGGAYYHFRDGKLARVTEGVQRHEVKIIH